jgi:hypothetical protein
VIEQEVDRRSDLLVLRATTNRSGVPVPVDVAGLGQLGEMDVIEFDPKPSYLLAVRRKFFGSEFTSSSGIRFGDRAENSTPVGMAEDTEQTIQRFAASPPISNLPR